MKAIILASDESKQMKSKIPAHVFELMGRPLLSYVIDAQSEVCGGPPVVVVGHNREQISERIKQAVVYAVQEQQLGTGRALTAAAEYIPPDGDVLIQYGNAPLIRPETVRRLAARHAESGDAATSAHAWCGDASLFAFKGAPLLEALRRLDSESGRYSISDVIKTLVELGYATGEMVLHDCEPDEFLTVDDRAWLARAVSNMKSRINCAHMLSGVTLIDPAATYIDHGVRIGEDTVIYPNTFIEKGSVIGCGCIIGPGSRVTNSKIGDRAEILNSVVIDASVGEATSVGPFAYIRPGSVIGAHCKVGDFVEVKNSVIGDNTKASHLTYIGDSDVGSNVNFGCGTVTVNYDGKYKNRTTIGDGVFVGCNTNLVAPVTVHSGAYIAAGSTITEEVPGEGLAIARARQVHKSEWRRKE